MKRATLSLPTTESNARAIAERRGYVLTQRRGRIEVHTRDGQRVGTFTQWSATLRFLVAAPRLDDGPEAA